MSDSGRKFWRSLEFWILAFLGVVSAVFAVTGPVPNDRLRAISPVISNIVVLISGFFARFGLYIALIVIIWLAYWRGKRAVAVITRLLLQFRPPKLHHLICYAYASKTAGDFNTAITIINYGVLSQSKNPKATPTKLTFCFYPQARLPRTAPNIYPPDFLPGTAFIIYPQGSSPGVAPITYTTNSFSPGSGLDKEGDLLPGGTYSVFLSQLLDPAGIKTNSFTGFIVLTSDSPSVHCQAILSNFTTLGFSTDVLSF